MLDCPTEVAPVKTLKRDLGTLSFYSFETMLPRFDGFEALLDLYAEKRGNKAMPTRRSFGFRELRGWHANFMLLEFSASTGEGVMRILGETYRTLFDGALWQGMQVSETHSPALMNLTTYFLDLLGSPFIGRYQGSLPHEGREHVYADVLDLPATDDNGVPRYVMSFIRETRRQR